MQINSITRIEQFICDSLIASPLVPIGVNVMRLADAAENEGVVAQTNTIVVRYVNSTSVVKNRVPFIYEETLFFELNFMCQSYLSSSGHDFATQLLMAAKMTISGSAPSGAYVQVLEPFHCTSSQFTGIDEASSQYTYSQTYGVVIEEVLPFISLDPCVQRGDCRQIFPTQSVVAQLPLAGILDENTGKVYIPWWPGNNSPLSETFSPVNGVQWSDEINQSGDWVYVCAPDEVFIEDPINQPIYLLSNNNFTEDGRLVVTVWDSESRQPIKDVFYADSGKKLARYAIELWRNTVLGSSTRGIDPDSVLDAAWNTGFNTGRFAVVTGVRQTLYSNPLEPETKKQTVVGGTLIGVDDRVFIETPQGRFYLVLQSPQGRGWVLQDGFEIASVNSLWRLGCLPCEGGPNPPPLCL
jgi:hypothetical protein